MLTAGHCSPGALLTDFTRPSTQRLQRGGGDWAPGHRLCRDRDSGPWPSREQAPSVGLDLRGDTGPLSASAWAWTETRTLGLGEDTGALSALTCAGTRGLSRPRPGPAQGRGLWAWACAGTRTLSLGQGLHGDRDPRPGSGRHLLGARSGSPTHRSGQGLRAVLPPLPVPTSAPGPPPASSLSWAEVVPQEGERGPRSGASWDTAPQARGRGMPGWGPRERPTDHKLLSWVPFSGTAPGPHWSYTGLARQASLVTGSEGLSSSPELHSWCRALLGFAPGPFMIPNPVPYTTSSEGENTNGLQAVDRKGKPF